MEWNKNFQENRKCIADIYDERFCRMWEFYLLSAETMFRTGAQMVFQIQLSRIREATGLTRDYMFTVEEKYRKQDAEMSLADWEQTNDLSDQVVLGGGGRYTDTIFCLTGEDEPLQGYSRKHLFYHAGGNFWNIWSESSWNAKENSSARFVLATSTWLKIS